VVPDLRRRLPGRGCWVSKSRVKVDEAERRGAFARALGEEVKPLPGLANLVGKLLREELVQALSLCRKAGLSVSGFTKVEEALTKGHIRALIHAVGAAADGAAKLNRRTSGNVAILQFFSPVELALAFGRENVVHAALSEGGQTLKLLDLAKGLAHYENLTIEGLN
jgi:uncharacterized protein